MNLITLVTMLSPPSLCHDDDGNDGNGTGAKAETERVATEDLQMERQRFGEGTNPIRKPSIRP